MRLIDADALLEHLNKNWYGDVTEEIKRAPTVEERPIHCKDCKYTVLSKDGKTLICCMTMKIGTVRPNFYCGNGEMKGGAE